MIPKKKIVVTGGAGFVGTNLIKFLLNKTNLNIIIIDNYSSGNKKNHIKNSRVKYLKGETSDISKIIKNLKNIKSLFHFGEFARIYQSFSHMNECIKSNSIGTNAVFNYCLKNKIKLGVDLFERKIDYKIVNIDETFPDYIVNNKKMFKDWIL